MAGQSASSAPDTEDIGVEEDTVPSDPKEAAAVEQARVRELLDALAIHQGRGGAQPRRHAFWETQPVTQYEEVAGSNEDGPIDAPKTVEDVKKDPYNLPANFQWCECDMRDPATVKEVYELLAQNYVEDDDNMFRFDYSPAFLSWALQPPGFKQEWHIGVRVSSSKKLVGFITAIPATLRVRGQAIKMVEINFLCVHKKLRSKRLAPVLIKEITRRVNLHDIWQAAYTAGVVIPTPVAECQYWHRSLNPKKLISVGFSKLSQRMTLARTIKLYRLAEKPATPGLRPMERRDVPQVTALLAGYLKQYQLAPALDEDEVAHWLMPVKGVINTYVVEKPGASGQLTDMLSFYSLPSSVLGNAEYDSLKAAYMYYTVADKTPLLQLMTDALICARDTGHDVFNALDMFENTKFLKDLKFGIGDGALRYYLYNWRAARGLTPQEVGLVLL